MKKILVVGGVAGGATTVARLRRLDEEAQIILFERDPYVSFANCGLPYYIGGSITERSKLLLQTPESFKARFNLDVRVNSKVVAIDTKKQEVSVEESDGKHYTESYTHLVLSPGAKPFVPPIKGIDLPRILSLRNVPDTDKIKEMVDLQSTKDVVVIGGGFIGVEMAENLVEIGLNTHLVEAAPHILAPFDSEIATMIEGELSKHGVNLMLGKKAIEFSEEGNQVVIHFETGETLKADLIVLAIGVQPDTQFIANSGINLDERGRILVDEHLQTNVPNVYALGDAIMVDHRVLGGKAHIPLAGPANRQGRIVANNLHFDKKESFTSVLGTSILKVFDLAAAATGSNERSLQAVGRAYQPIYIHPNSHATYYPGATALTIKMLYDPNTYEVLGAQAIGQNSVDKFIDSVAMAMHFKGTVYDLAEVELTYAPPYSSAKSPLNMAGFVARNIIEGLMPHARFEEALNIDPSKQILLDVRDDAEVAERKLEQSIHIAVNELRHGRENELDKSKEILVYCAVGVRGYIATRYLLSKGFKARNIMGGMKLSGGYGIQ
ncbi:FAD-dependent oxidoreductase [Entomospira culicis]|uniref:FAD-dependent oxidoreductase n=1 Tax=Entomospira culicis TaxID=2719989 RepID=A0A968GLA1_9SPIO|nr:FAD-dependent oxidoreductase [Entomospira culicis]NIZ19666.1 FAD-dependent oxidoreductase [Entomospira culicis]NIZ69880.1 FAD-dependent oxidoreductase [Entomospira culicis]WDI36985.1 FAD-dependent oxidoreductase [Entomospira culicis]WDI38614.1 FAD-dependent oxidoreductase [Entomospira culicis]